MLTSAQTDLSDLFFRIRKTADQRKTGAGNGEAGDHLGLDGQDRQAAGDLSAQHYIMLLKINPPLAEDWSRSDSNIADLTIPSRSPSIGARFTFTGPDPRPTIWYWTLGLSLLFDGCQSGMLGGFQLPPKCTLSLQIRFGVMGQAKRS